MELRHLRYFVAVVEEQNFTRAAERLHVAQPGVSAQLRQLERELGEPLLDRADRTVRLTAAGAAFLPYARAALDAVESGTASVAALVGLVEGRLRIGSVATISSGTLDLPGLLAEFHAEHPGVDIVLTGNATADLIADIQQGRVDVAFMGLGLRLPEEVIVSEVVRERLVAVLPPGARRAPKRLRIADLADRPLIIPRPGTGLRDRLDSAFATAGVRPRIAVESGEPNLLLDLALAGLGTAIVPASVVARRNDPSLRVAALQPRVDGTIALGWHRDRPLSPAARAFISHVGNRRSHNSSPRT